MLRDDELLIDRIEAGTKTTRALLCALARRGKALAQDEPARADRLLVAIRAHPGYKAGRLVFDLLELEDLLLDGPPPERVDGYFEADAVLALSRALERFFTALDSTLGARPRPTPDTGRGLWLDPEPAPPGGWPELLPSEYLFDLVVLGLLRQMSRAAAARPRVA